MTYDDENRLVSMYLSASWKTDFVYDGLGRLRSRAEYTWLGSGWYPNGTTTYVYDGMRVIQERVGGSPQVSYTRGSDLSGSLEGAGGIGGLLARSHAYQSGSGAFTNHNCYHADGNGNITYLVDNSQAKAAAYRYDPYGNTISSSGSLASANVYRFSSKEFHVNSGLYYYGYRWYHPNLQRWLNRDPIGEWGGLNLYGFVYNSPLNYVDPFGLDSTKISPEAAKIARDLLADELGIPLPDLSLAQGLSKKLAKKGIQKTLEQAHELNQAAKQAKKINDASHLFSKCKVKDTKEFHKFKDKLKNKFKDQLKGEDNPDILFDDQGRIVLRTVGGKVTAPTGLTVDEARKLLGLPAIP